MQISPRGHRKIRRQSWCRLHSREPRLPAQQVLCRAQHCLCDRIELGIGAGNPLRTARAPIRGLRLVRSEEQPNVGSHRLSGDVNCAL